MKHITLIVAEIARTEADELCSCRPLPRPCPRGISPVLAAVTKRTSLRRNCCKFLVVALADLPLGTSRTLSSEGLIHRTAAPNLRS
ncbi:Uncharacterised protein [Mycobacterium xenopi]|uniref:Uncharacterized protein n=1 Tax=Mycobacterium xenopi TaxID=1789 RepID=A0AAD1GWC0_MYCXE|nr:hypothetical protein MYXE_03130 [Mycobacterium xenopi]SPX79565.1 Uncharacterised protein [Mycobacterium xenopi]